MWSKLCAMKFNVIQGLMFGKLPGGIIREVTIPDENKGNDVMVTLEKVFHWGQNDFQPIDGSPSVSVGDIVIHGSKYFMVAPVGFRELDSSVVMSLLGARQIALVKEELGYADNYTVEFDRLVKDAIGKTWFDFLYK